MRYSLASRFRGSFVGAYLGECLALEGRNNSVGDKSVGDKSPGERSPVRNMSKIFDFYTSPSFSTSKANNSDDWGKVTVLSAQSLIEEGKLDLDVWTKHLHPINTSHEAKNQPKNQAKNQLSPQAILTVLPVALFFHENPIKLRQNLLYVVEILGDDSILQDAMLAFGYAIALALTEKLHPQTLIPQIISFMGETPTSLPETSLSENLLKVNLLLAEGAGLERVRGELNNISKSADLIAMSFYCFLATLEDFRLGVLRSTQLGSHSWQIASITGALSGAYNSMAGIPVTWPLLPNHRKTLYSWGFSDFAQMLQLSDALAASWSGVCSPLHPVAEGVEVPTVAAPRVIR
jgi:ADP-ribosylglycohydrolase